METIFDEYSMENIFWVFHEILTKCLWIFQMACKRFPNLGIFHGYWNILMVINSTIFMDSTRYIPEIFDKEKKMMINQILGCHVFFFRQIQLCLESLVKQEVKSPV